MVRPEVCLVVLLLFARAPPAGATSSSTAAQLVELKRVGVLAEGEFASATAKLAALELELRKNACAAAPVLHLSAPVRDVASSLAQLATLKATGMLSEQEFGAAKAMLLLPGLSTGEAGAPQDTGAGDAYGGKHVTWEELATHNSSGDLWVAIHDEVYNFSCFAATPPCYAHPGGLDAISKHAGADATKGFEAAGHRSGIAARKGLADIVIGRMASPAATRAISQRAKQSSSVFEDKPEPPYGAAPEVWQQEGVGFPPGGWRTVIGRSTWHFIHSAAGKYPERKPKPQQEKAMRALLEVLVEHYPCEACRYALPDEIKALPPMPTKTREEVSLWWCELHNLVSIDIGKETFNCSLQALDDIYVKNCGTCSAMPASGTMELNIPGMKKKKTPMEEDPDYLFLKSSQPKLAGLSAAAASPSKGKNTGKGKVKASADASTAEAVQQAIALLSGMGFSAEQAKLAAEHAKGDANAAIDYALTL